MKLKQMRFFNFQSFGGAEATAVSFDDLTFFIGPNGSGKTAVLQGLCRMFSIDPKARRVLRTDFHVPFDKSEPKASLTQMFWVEADFEFPELSMEADVGSPSVPPNFAHMRMDAATGESKLRIRLEATMDAEGEIEEQLWYVAEEGADGSLRKYQVLKQDRSNIQVHYLPARRDPADHISYGTSSLLGRVLRSVSWKKTHDEIVGMTQQISETLSATPAIEFLSDELETFWGKLHTGEFFAQPEISFQRKDIESLLRHLSIVFSPGHNDVSIDYSRLSDGQKSLLYLSLVLTVQGIGRRAMAGECEDFDLDKLKPAVFTFVAMEEPENSLSAHYLGRIVNSLSEFSKHGDCQSAIATHAPSLLKRIGPDSIRYLRLNGERQTLVKTILLPDKTDDAHKFIREAVQAFPEIYFSRLVILGEGASEQVVLPRIMEAHGLFADISSISIAPLGGRHVNHFWRLLTALEIPFLTLLDLDLARHQGGWGRIRYVVTQLINFPQNGSKLTTAELAKIPKWNAPEKFYATSGSEWITYLEQQGVYFSSPLDLDFTMLKKFPLEYGFATPATKTLPDAATVTSVLGKCDAPEQYSSDDQSLFECYSDLFKQSSKPVAHIAALSKITNDVMKVHAPESILRLLNAAESILAKLPE